jgi:hypothetical protein
MKEVENKSICLDRENVAGKELFLQNVIEKNTVETNVSNESHENFIE